ncbi:MAG TPA: hypothetical protein VFQ43_03265 [Nitrososphaera sp.]|nr:hypothetical protein [Nitrososphaera sp.]
MKSSTDFAQTCLWIGALLGALISDEDLAELADALREKRLWPEYVIALRDRLTAALRKADQEEE